LRPLPYADPDRLIVLNETHPRIGTISVSYPNFLEVDIPLTQPTPTYRLQEWRTTRAPFRSSRIVFQQKKTVEPTWSPCDGRPDFGARAVREPGR
jgi:hypothetical protein